MERNSRIPMIIDLTLYIRSPDPVTLVPKKQIKKKGTSGKYPYCRIPDDPLFL